MRGVREKGGARSTAPQTPIMKVLVYVIQAIAKHLHPSVVEDMVCRVGVQLGREGVAEYRQARRAGGRFDPHPFARCLEAIGKQCGWKCRVKVESDDVMAISLLDCPFRAPGEAGHYVCKLVSGFFGAVVADELGYAKASISGCDGTSLAHCIITIYIRQTEESLAATGVVYRQMADEVALVAEGQPNAEPGQRLTTREAQVLRLIAQGLSNKKIATVFHLSVRTVENHAARIRQKLGIDSRTALVRFALRTHLVEL